jgi:hypothetical protein
MFVNRVDIPVNRDNTRDMPTTTDDLLAEATALAFDGEGAGVVWCHTCNRPVRVRPLGSDLLSCEWECCNYGMAQGHIVLCQQSDDCGHPFTYTHTCQEA